MTPRTTDGTFTFTRRYWRQVVVLSSLTLLLGAFVFAAVAQLAPYGGPAGVGLGSDFAMFYTGARVSHAGENPYDYRLLDRDEVATFTRQGVRPSHKIGWVRVGNPPLLFVLLEPLTGLPFRVAGWLWIALMELLSLVGLICCLQYLGWSRQWVAVLPFLGMPIVLIGVLNGNVVPVVFAGTTAGLALMRRNPMLAGALSSVAWLKPGVALPFILLIFLFHAPDRWRFGVGFVASFLVLGVATLLATGPHSVATWFGALSAYSGDIRKQPEMASATGLYFRIAGPGLRQILQVAGLAVALAVTGIVWLRLRTRGTSSVLSLGWLWILSFLCVPYAHTNDAILLAPPLLALLGTNGRRTAWFLPAVTLYLLFAIALRDPLTVAGVQTEPIKFAVVGVCLALAARSTQYRDDSASPSPNSVRNPTYLAPVG